MNALSIVILVFMELLAIAGQILFKLAMGHRWDQSRSQAAVILTGGVGAMALRFFLWLGLLSFFDLSQLYPFEGMNRIVLLAAAAIFLRERITPSLIAGGLLIGAGVVLVATS
jgi:drug/metabolite transporter (DMT)-like permease